MSENRMTPGGLLLVGGLLCLDFCNTITERFAPQPIDMLAKHRYLALVDWSHEVELLSDAAAEKLNALDTGEAETVFTSAVGLRDALYRLSVAAKAGDAAPDDALLTLNTWLQQAMQHRELVPAAGGGYAWRWREPDVPERMLWEISLSAAEMLMHEDMSRLRQCPGCGWLFYDQSRNNSRTWCDMRFCGNRAKNKRFHARQKPD
jgi:predicted RNA-binding Zn ribbon-like protein